MKNKYIRADNVIKIFCEIFSLGNLSHKQDKNCH